MTVKAKTVKQLRDYAKVKNIPIPRGITKKADIAYHIEMAEQQKNVPKPPPLPPLSTTGAPARKKYKYQLTYSISPKDELLRSARIKLNRHHADKVLQHLTTNTEVEEHERNFQKSDLTFRVEGGFEGEELAAYYKRMTPTYLELMDGVRQNAMKSSFVRLTIAMVYEKEEDGKTKRIIKHSVRAQQHLYKKS